MSIRRDRTDVADQQARLADATEQLAASLDNLSAEAHTQAKVARRKRPTPDLVAIRAALNTATRALDAAELDVDAAAYDLATAGGEDG